MRGGSTIWRGEWRVAGWRAPRRGAGLALLITLVTLVFGGACRESYVPPVGASAVSRLVVEGFINNGSDSTIISLTRTYNLGVDDTASATPELHAQVQVQGEDNSSYALAETGHGKYAAPGLILNNSVRYRLHIRTSGGKEYGSDYVTLKPSPQIDSISWKPVNGDIHIYANTHDPQNASVYYRWTYSETWQFHSVYPSMYIYTGDTVLPRGFDSIYTCWKSDNSTNTLLGSSVNLSRDLIAEAPMVTIPANSWEIGVEYSIGVTQYVLTPDAYDFWLNLQKNTEQIGSVFSPQPSETAGNIHNLADSAEQVIGYISGGTMSKQRIFIKPDQIPGWQIENYPNLCLEFGISGQKDSLKYYLGRVGYLIIDQSPFVPIRYSVSDPFCIDCTLQGSNIKPPFWP
jgi:hypothetical protein